MLVSRCRVLGGVSAAEQRQEKCSGVFFGVIGWLSKIPESELDQLHILCEFYKEARDDGVSKVGLFGQKQHAARR